MMKLLNGIEKADLDEPFFAMVKSYLHTQVLSGKIMGMFLQKGGNKQLVIKGDGKWMEAQGGLPGSCSAISTLAERFYWCSRR